jgi:long-subunit fatty acid transport protein
MKIRNKIIALMISLIAIPTFAIAKDGPYLGVQASKINVDYKTIEGIDLGRIYADQFNALDLHVGYNFGDSFVEFGYLKSSDESKSLGTYTSGSITVSGSTNLKFDGWRIGAGHNFKINDQLSIKPFINYYNLNVDETWTVTVTGSTTLQGSASYGGSDNMIDVGLGFDYKINENSKIGLSYSRSIDQLQNTDKTQVYSISYNHKF